MYVLYAAFLFWPSICHLLTTRAPILTNVIIYLFLANLIIFCIFSVVNIHCYFPARLLASVIVSNSKENCEVIDLWKKVSFRENIRYLTEYCYTIENSIFEFRHKYNPIGQ